MIRVYFKRTKALNHLSLLSTLSLLVLLVLLLYSCSYSVLVQYHGVILLVLVLVLAFALKIDGTGMTPQTVGHLNIQLGGGIFGGKSFSRTP